ncbi:LOW QUALITY PROTEIN: ankyrin repeat and SAM domain-containing protein 6-like [Saccoglossus kowalevskii]|uniref:LOW QUALITY PROTEIN: ankyrin repeat and SAM domain-containing protein 6-like n=1 Tax=Saccoglossus kowalevskii TaxID=10224 RepID=A0ABM0MYI8_SACKO|nr:PREDICTED: LOW QUALITY PROTEIN: ankyrin repeat and SAM domain-containing protein 6-like [Saccoglossus kowalevskii]
MVDVDDHDETVTRLLSACEHGDTNTVQTLVEQDLAAVDACDGEGSSLLHVSAANGHESLVRYLIMRGAKIDLTNSYGWTALMQAARGGYHKVVALLLQNKVDVNVKNKLGVSALTVAARGGHTQVVRMLLEVPVFDLSDDSQTVTPLIVAAQYGHDTVVRLLLDRGARVNHQDENTGWNPLMVTALNGHMTTAQILVDRGCDPNVTNLLGRTALSIAIQSGKRSREVRGYLDRKTTNKPKLEPEDIEPNILDAAKTGNIKRIRVILHDDVKAADTIGEDGGTPLMFAAMRGQLEIVELLVNYGADVNRQDTASGWTALMQATYYGKKEVAKYLITQGADVNIQAKDGCTAFDLAVLIDDTDTELVRQLASVGMKVNKPQRGKSASMPWASRSKSSENMNNDDDPPKSGLKAWWSRMSNRFRNLKLTSTFRARFSSNRLQPFHDENTTTDATLKAEREKNDHKRKSSSTMNLDELDRKLSSPKKSASIDSGLDNSQTSKALYTLSLASPTSKLPNEKLMPVIPPFLPPPSFDLSSSDRPKMQSLSSKTSSPETKGGVNRRIMQSAKFSSPRSPSDSANYGYESSSPNSSAGAEGVGRVFTASHRSHPMYRRHTYDPSVNRPRPVSYPTMAFISGPSEIHLSSIQHKYKSSNRVNANVHPGGLNSSNSSTTSSSLTPSRPNQHFSGTSQSSTTLTPSASPDPRGYLGSTISSSTFSSSSHKQKNTSSSSGISEDDELSLLMKKLSLEKYTPIFEEQEVDMEAFLTLTDDDLKELGISHMEPRRQILSVISELNTGKGREREFLRTTLTNYHVSEFPHL